MAHFTFKSYLVPKAETVQYSGFCYIGRTAVHIDKLVNMYKRGYAFEGIENVKAELIRNVQENKNMLPEVIICEAGFDFAEIRSFCQFLKAHSALATIPFLIDASGLSEHELKLCRKNARPDDILFLNNCTDADLSAKVRFLTRIKATVANTVPPRIEEHFPKHQHIGFIFKRMFDILVSSIAILILSPVFLLIALAIRLESRGSIFYISKRAGRGYRIFNFYKFRTMQQGADQKMSELTHLNQYRPEGVGPVFFKINNDPRITKLGSILRNTSLDELPQLWNVLKGDMSLVGPRPLVADEDRMVDEWARGRLELTPGITGLWQVLGRTSIPFEEMVRLDYLYVTNWSLWGDIRLILRTLPVVLRRNGAN